mmetsp:Transcript_5725/g.9035  ORF Transcript_5725/g.9035 Transcript_5725/m.9035 type:complete len:351 (-) Transcript_5725:132-1184(-)
MPRSEEAILRRALKRQRTEEEQRRADRLDMFKQQERSNAKAMKEVNKSRGRQLPSKDMETNNHAYRQELGTGKEPWIPTKDPMKEPGAWTCPKCQNSNFASRRFCFSKTCNEPRPSSLGSTQNASDGSWICPACSNLNYSSRKVCFSKSCGQRKPIVGSPLAHQRSDRVETKKRPRHDGETSKKLIWANQADSEKLSKNQELRQRYLETGGEGMTQEDRERAEILVARDERKKAKKSKKTLKTSDETATATASSNSTVFTDANTEDATEPEQEQRDSDQPDRLVLGKDKNKKSNSKAKRDKNNALRQLYLETQGKGMRTDQIERAMLLIARDERKRKKRDAAKADKVQDQ